MASNLTSKVALYMRALDLPNMDKFSKTDGFVVVKMKNKDLRSGTGDDQWIEVYRTKTIQDNLNPQWAEAAMIDYRFEEKQFLRFEVYDRDSKKENLKKQDFIGSYETSVSKILGKPGSALSGRLKKKNGKPRKKAKFIITAEEVTTDKDLVHLHFSCTKLDRKNMGGLGTADPFYIISNQHPDGKMNRVFESEVIKKTRKPVWKAQKIPVAAICNGEYDRTITIDVFDWESDGKHNYIGSCETTLDGILKAKNFVLKNKKKKKGSSGVLHVRKCEVIDKSGFLEYIEGGCEMKLTVAVDFTGSNGHPSETHSLHYMPPNFKYNGGDHQIKSMNDYQKVLVSVGQIMQDYDSDRKIPAYGFGANLGPGPMDMHCFPLSLNPKKHEVKGVKGMMMAYQHSLKHVTLSGPTHFSNVIRRVIDTTPPVTQEDQSYSVLMIITDGVVNDLPKTIDAIIDASSKPISIIIVGVGDTDWEPMDVLDADGKLLSARGRTAQRDIVQFVPYNKFKDESFTTLAEEVLREVPYQMESFFKLNGLKPNPKRPIPESMWKPLPVLEDASDDEEGNDDEE